MPLGHNRQEDGAEYIIITKERLVLASAPYAPNESFYHQAQKHTILNFIRGILIGGHMLMPLIFQVKHAKFFSPNKNPRI